MKYILIVLVILFTSEALVSEVFVVKSELTLKQIIFESSLIVEVSGDDNGTEVIKTTIFPKETHYLKQGPRTYVEKAKLVTVLNVFKGTPKHSDKKIKIYIKEDYDLQSEKISHETGAVTSPVVEKYEPKFPVAEKKPRIQFLVPSKQFPDIYESLGEEGLEAKTTILETLKKSQTNKSF